MSLRDWLILIGILVIIGVLADGYRRMRLARKRASELSFGLEEVKGYDDDFSSELPNGGARSRSSNESHSRKDQLRERVEPDFSSADYSEGYAEYEQVYSEPSRQREHPKPTVKEPDTDAYSDELADTPEFSEKTKSQRALDLGEPVPVLMNLDESHQSGRAKRFSPSEDVLQSEGFSRTEGPDRSVRSREASRLSAEPEEFVSRPRVASSKGKATIQEREVSARDNPNPQKELNLGGREKAEKLKDRPPASEVIVINVLSKGGGIFAGEQLMQSMLASGMRFGDMSIFHRYSNADGTGKILFSMANGVKPGTFTIDNLEATETPALSLFMSLPGPEKPMQAFALMEETARRLALDLGGELKDEQFSVMTQQTLEHCRQRIREYERKQLAKQPVH
ncbi:cell division protein ZipA [Endozoicomonas elysicola]|uniref:Cell division protein ZipA n=1 Tax=Endozoicomonas elysicola TaxID=305900 RepID=A0A081KEU5_9GAMM|nr:cell division protein ZipA [Endozoicomonas elysicola]KEI72671.1 hypothetical protein GV64_19800 [Endozoicomonas elysicola]